MSPAIARTLRQYALFLLPAKVNERFPTMTTTLHRKLKEWYDNMPAKKRHGFLINAQHKGPLSEEYRAIAYQAGIILDWPPKRPQRGSDVKSKSEKTARVSRRSLPKKLQVREMVRPRVPKGAGG